MRVLSLRRRLSERSVKRGEFLHHDLVSLRHIRVNGLGVLTKIVEAREGLSAVTSEGPFTGVFADVTCEMLAPGEYHPTVTKSSALEHGHISAAFRLVRIGILG